jgi:nicotinate-nucleotide adenylyltransferase
MLPAVHRGLLGGTFDPPHVAHLVAAEAAYRQLGLDVVSFVPAGAPWQKAGDDIAAGEHRLAMTRLASVDVEYFEVDDRELRRDGWTYTIDTLASFPQGERISLLLGADAARGVPSWHRAGELLATGHFAVVPRPGVTQDEVADAFGDADFVWLDMPELDISSTDLRRRVAAGASVRFLVPEAVREYIDAHGLYRHH